MICLFEDKKVIAIPCDLCGTESSCRFEYIDEAKGDLPMLFCSLDCLASYVETAKEASELDNLLAKGGQRKALH